MRHVHVSEEMRLRFPNRGAEFDEGVEIGVVAVLMNMPLPSFSRRLSTANLPQIRELASRMGYRVDEEADDDGWTEVDFHLGRRGPSLRLAAVQPASAPLARRDAPRAPIRLMAVTGP